MENGLSCAINLYNLGKNGQPTIESVYEVLKKKIGREPTYQELVNDINRIMCELRKKEQRQ